MSILYPNGLFVSIAGAAGETSTEVYTLGKESRSRGLGWPQWEAALETIGFETNAGVIQSVRGNKRTAVD